MLPSFILPAFHASSLPAHPCLPITNNSTYKTPKQTHTHTERISSFVPSLLILPASPPSCSSTIASGLDHCAVCRCYCLASCTPQEFFTTVLHDCHDASHASRVRDLAPSVGGSAAPVFTPNPSKTHFHSLFKLYAPPQSSRRKNARDSQPGAAPNGVGTKQQNRGRQGSPRGIRISRSNLLRHARTGLAQKERISSILILESLSPSMTQIHF